MIHRILQTILFTVLLAGCFANMTSLENASVSYKEHKDYASLEDIYKRFSKGLQRKEVERLLGEPDYSPIEGQYYYSSDQSEYSENQERKVSIGLVVDYRDSNGRITKRLQEFWLGPIAE
jgi:hypothetical protein